MATVSTDDAARQQRPVWLGPTNSPWPFEATYTAWVIGLIAVPTFTAIAGAALKPVTAVLAPGPVGYLLMIAGAVIAGTILGVMVTRFLGRLISPETPLAHHAMVLVAEVTGPRETPPTMHLLSSPDTMWVEDQKTTHRIVPPTFKD